MAERPVIVADDAIGWVREVFGDLGTLRTMPGRAIDRAALRDADALLVRTVTKVDTRLLDGTPVRFVGSATAGDDHLDRTALANAGITVASAPGSNATAVADYVLGALAWGAMRRGEPFLASGPIGVVGFGFCGRRVTARLRALGATVLVCDPPLAHARIVPPAEEPTLAAMIERESFADLATVLGACSVVSLHVPLTRAGAWPTWQMIDAAALAALPPGALLINTARGGVVDDDSLARWIGAGHGDAVLDVWADEPIPDPDLVARILIATPHIAGYSVEGKLAATRMIADAFAACFGIARRFDPATILAQLDAPSASPRSASASSANPAIAPPSAVTRPGEPAALAARRSAASVDAEGATELERVAAFIRSAIDLRATDRSLRDALTRAGFDRTARAHAFESLRTSYTLRRELSAIVTGHAISGIVAPPPDRRSG